MAGVTHADSAAIGSMCGAWGSCGGGRRAAVAAVQSMIGHSLKLTKVDQVIEVFSTVDAAAVDLAGRRLGERLEARGEIQRQAFFRAEAHSMQV